MPGCNSYLCFADCQFRFSHLGHCKEDLAESRIQPCLAQSVQFILGAVAAQRGIAADALGSCVLRPWHLESLGNLVKRVAVWANGVADGGAERSRRALLRSAADVTPAHA